MKAGIYTMDDKAAEIASQLIAAIASDVPIARYKEAIQCALMEAMQWVHEQSVEMVRDDFDVTARDGWFRLGHKVPRNVYFRNEPLFIVATEHQAKWLVELLNCGIKSQIEPLRASLDASLPQESGS